MKLATPGPWKVEEVHATARKKRGLVYAKIVAASDERHIGFAGVYEQNERDNERILADATLIAAAPELARVGHRLYLAVQALSARSLMDANANARNMREAAEAVQEWREVSEKAGIE